jgi:hypothetical protein
MSSEGRSGSDHGLKVTELSGRAVVSPWNCRFLAQNARFPPILCFDGVGSRSSEYPPSPLCMTRSNERTVNSKPEASKAEELLTVVAPTSPDIAQGKNTRLSCVESRIVRNGVAAGHLERVPASLQKLINIIKHKQYLRFSECHRGSLRPKQKVNSGRTIAANARWDQS